MGTGFQGTFVISWSQTSVDGLGAAPIDFLVRGAVWTWHGESVRVDGPSGLLRLEEADGEAELRRRAARTVRRLVGAAIRNTTDIASVEVNDPLMESSFVVTDGIRSFTVTLIDTGRNSPPLCMFVDQIPPRDTDLWLVHVTLPEHGTGDARQGGVICFTPGTRILTPAGPQAIEALRVGDRIQTRDNGAQRIYWIGRRRMTGARMFVTPALRPIRISPGALGIERPDQTLIVSPEHRMLVRGAAARALFNTPEVLVAASDLVNGTSVTVDLTAREVIYIHLLLESHQILWANGVETESFHPANADFASLSEFDRNSLLGLLPGIDRDPYSYGEHARRNLTASEAAILRHQAA